MEKEERARKKQGKSKKRVRKEPDFLILSEFPRFSLLEDFIFYFIFGTFPMLEILSF